MMFRGERVLFPIIVGIIGLFGILAILAFVLLTHPIGRIAGPGVARPRHDRLHHLPQTEEVAAVRFAIARLGKRHSCTILRESGELELMDELAAETPRAQDARAKSPPSRSHSRETAAACAESPLIPAYIRARAPFSACVFIRLRRLLIGLSKSFAGLGFRFEAIAGTITLGALR